jgi:hypothetical protein
MTKKTLLLPRWIRRWLGTQSYEFSTKLSIEECIRRLELWRTTYGDPAVATRFLRSTLPITIEHVGTGYRFSIPFSRNVSFSIDGMLQRDILNTLTLVTFQIKPFYANVGMLLFGLYCILTGSVFVLISFRVNILLGLAGIIVMLALALIPYWVWRLQYKHCVNLIYTRLDSDRAA